DGNPQTGWALAPAVGVRHVGVYQCTEPIYAPNGATLTFTLEQHFAGKDHNIGKFRLSATTDKGSISLDGPPEAIAKALAVPADKRTADQKATLANHYRSIDPELARLNQVLAEHPKPPSDKRQLGAQDLVWALINTPEFLFNH